MEAHFTLIFIHGKQVNSKKELYEIYETYFSDKHMLSQWGGVYESDKHGFGMDIHAIDSELDSDLPLHMEAIQPIFTK